jgi:four helix bundle protein
MTEQELLKRTKSFALRVIGLVEALPNSIAGRKIGDQLVRAGASVGANYRAACRGRSRAEFAAKLGTVEEEADECAYWMELIMEANLLKSKRVLPLHDEVQQIRNIIARSRLTLMRNSKAAAPSSKIANRKSQIANPQ